MKIAKRKAKADAPYKHDLYRREFELSLPLSRITLLHKRAVKEKNNEDSISAVSSTRLEKTYIDSLPFVNLLELLVINHSSSERRNIFVPRRLKLSCVLVVLQLVGVRTSPRSGLALCGIVPNGPADSVVSFNISQGLSVSMSHQYRRKLCDYNAPELRPSLITRLRQFVRGELDSRSSFPVVFSKIVIFSAEFKPILSQPRGILEPKNFCRGLRLLTHPLRGAQSAPQTPPPPPPPAPLAFARSFSRQCKFFLFRPL